MKEGQAIKSDKRICDLVLEEYNVVEINWKDPIEGKYLVDTNEFARGGFRKVFKIKCFGGEFEKGSYVLKEFLNEESSVIEKKEGMRKNVQMHMVARHLANALAKDAPAEFGECFQYDQAFCLEFDGVPVSVEKFYNGEFKKYINNNGEFNLK